MDNTETNTNEQNEISSDLILSIEKTKSSLSRKISKLEDEITDTLHNAKDTVLEEVKEVKKMFNVRHQIEKHPWESFTGAVLVGLLLSKTFNSSNNFSKTSVKQNHIDPQPTSPQKNSFLQEEIISVFETLGESAKHEISQIKTKALSELLDSARSYSKQLLPPLFFKNIDNIFKNVIEKLS